MELGGNDQRFGGGGSLLLGFGGCRDVAGLVGAPDGDPEFGGHIGRAVDAAGGANQKCRQEEARVPDQAGEPHFGKVLYVGDVGRGVFEPGQLGYTLLDPGHEIRRNFDTGGAGEIVDEEWKIGGGGDDAIVFDDAPVALAIEEGRDAADGFDAGPGRVFGEAGGAGGGGGTYVHDVVNAPLILVGGDLGYAAVFGVVEEDAFPRAAGHPESLYTGLDVELHYLAKGVLVEVVISGHRRDDGRENPIETFHVALSCGCDEVLEPSLSHGWVRVSITV